MPLGTVVFTIAPWNYPYLTAVNSIIPALMAGNAGVVLKHASHTLLVGEQFFSPRPLRSAGLAGKGLFHNLVLDRSHDQVAEVISLRSWPT